MPAWDEAPIIEPAQGKRPAWADAPVVRSAKLANVEPKEFDPTDGMSTTEKVLSGIGSGMTSVGRALGLGGVAEHFGLPGTKEEAERNDAALMNTTSGKVGNVVGHVAGSLPAVLIPGGQTLGGAALIGAGTGAATTEGGLEDRAKGAAGGAVGGVIGKVAGDAIGSGVRSIKASATAKGAAQQTANAGRDAATKAAADAGYVIPPTQANPSRLNQTLEGFAGKASTAQAASNLNQQRTNMMVRKALGLAEDAPLTTETMDAIRAQAGQAYNAVASVGKIPAAANELPKSVNVQAFTDKLTMAPRREVDAADLVSAWKQANHNATAYYRAYGRDANPETLAKAKAFAGDAKKIDDFITKKLTSMGKGDLVQSLKDARVLIAKTYNAEAALNPSAGNVSATQLGTQLAKGKPLSGELKQAAQFGQAFPKAAQDPSKIGSVLGTSPLDWFGSAGLSAATGNPLALASVASRPAVRSLVLSKPFQAVAARAPSYGPGAITNAAPQVLDTELARAIARLNGIDIGRRLATDQ